MSIELFFDRPHVLFPVRPDVGNLAQDHLEDAEPDRKWLSAVEEQMAEGAVAIAAARRLAAHYGLPHLDTGLLYRATACALPPGPDANKKSGRGDDMDARLAALKARLDKKDPDTVT